MILVYASGYDNLLREHAARLTAKLPIGVRRESLSETERGPVRIQDVARLMINHDQETSLTGIKMCKRGRIKICEKPSFSKGNVSSCLKIYRVHSRRGKKIEQLAEKDN